MQESHSKQFYFIPKSVSRRDLFRGALNQVHSEILFVQFKFDIIICSSSQGFIEIIKKYLRGNIHIKLKWRGGNVHEQVNLILNSKNKPEHFIS